jgi:hypothetical protein
MMEKENNISPKDFELVKLADTADEVAKHVLDFYSHMLFSHEFLRDSHNSLNQLTT